MATYSALAKSNLITTVQALKVQAFDKMLQMRALPESIFFKLGGNIIDKMTPIPATEPQIRCPASRPHNRRQY